MAFAPQKSPPILMHSFYKIPLKRFAKGNFNVSRLKWTRVVVIGPLPDEIEPLHQVFSSYSVVI